jgi:sugar/nucleoside kinase (ribokinase family)
MVSQIAVTCVGDLMLELYALQGGRPRAQRTYEFDHAAATVGGGALNLCWYFSQLRRSSTIVAGFGVGDRDRVEAALKKARVDVASLVQLSSVTDILAVLPGKDLPAAYIRGRIDDQDLAALANRLSSGSVIIFTGSRHENFRRVVLQRVLELGDLVFVFSPSYSVYDFRHDELDSFVHASDIIVVNEHEAEYLAHVLCRDGNADLMKLAKQGGIVTLGPRGADLFCNGQTHRVASISGRDDDVIGAGEAFLAGFVHAFLESSNWERSGRVGCAVAAQVVQAKPTLVRAPIDIKRLSDTLGPDLINLLL